MSRIWVRPSGVDLKIARGVAEALDYAHRNDIIHRDIKPANILLYEMLAGQPPHTGPSAQSILVRILTEDPRPLRRIEDGPIRETRRERTQSASHCATSW